MSTLAVVEQILRETENPMSVREIVKRAAGRLPTRSRTPDTVVARDLSMDIKKKGEQSLFIRTEPGRYAIREIYLRKRAGENNGRNEARTQATEPRDIANPAVAARAGRKGENAPTRLVASVIRRERTGTLPARMPATRRPDTRPGNSLAD